MAAAETMGNYWKKKLSANQCLSRNEIFLLIEEQDKFYRRYMFDIPRIKFLLQRRVRGKRPFMDRYQLRQLKMTWLRIKLGHLY